MIDSIEMLFLTMIREGAEANADELYDGLEEAVKLAKADGLDESALQGLFVCGLAMGIHLVAHTFGFQSESGKDCSDIAIDTMINERNRRAMERV